MNWDNQLSHMISAADGSVAKIRVRIFNKADNLLWVRYAFYLSTSARWVLLQKKIKTFHRAIYYVYCEVLATRTDLAPKFRLMSRL